MGETVRAPSLPDVPSVKPRFRGRTHEWAFFASLGLLPALLTAAPSGSAKLVAAIYGSSVAALFGASALYHRVTWRRVSARRWMRRLDHAMIFVLIAGTYTPFAVLALDGGLAKAILIVVWAGALGGVVLKLVWIDAPKALVAGVYVALGWVAVAAFPDMLEALGFVPTALVVLGGLLYSAGALVYVLKRPDPSPTVFGYHEIFHVLVIAAAALQYAVVAFYVIPRA
jgi:hemolysin III